VRLLAGLIAARRGSPGDDLLSAMIAARDDEDQLSEDELVSLAFLILWAGYENSVHLIGNSILALLTSQQLMAGLPTGEPLPGPAIEELIRFADPNQYAIRRFATEDLSIGGVRIPAGDTVLLCLASANRDPARFADPGALDLARTGNPHLSFGLGIHYCLGAPLARIETGIAISSLLRRLPGLTLAAKPDELRWRPSAATGCWNCLSPGIPTWPYSSRAIRLLSPWDSDGAFLLLIRRYNDTGRPPGGCNALRNPKFSGFDRPCSARCRGSTRRWLRPGSSRRGRSRSAPGCAGGRPWPRERGG